MTRLSLDDWLLQPLVNIQTRSSSTIIPDLIDIRLLFNLPAFMEYAEKLGPFSVKRNGGLLSVRLGQPKGSNQVWIRKVGYFGSLRAVLLALAADRHKYTKGWPSLMLYTPTTPSWTTLFQ